MSDGARKPREWRFYVADMIEFGRKVWSGTLFKPIFLSCWLNYQPS